MIIFEGTDCVGKTTAALKCAASLAQEGSLGCFKRYGFLPPDWDYAGDYARDVGLHNVLDRFTTSEVVYGMLFRNGVHPSFTQLNQAVIARELQLNGALTVLVMPPLDQVLDKLKSRGDASFNVEQITKAYHLFMDVMLPTVVTWDGVWGVWNGRSEYDYTHVLAFNRYLTERDLELILTHHQAYAKSHEYVNSLGMDVTGPMDGACQAVMVGDVQNHRLEPMPYVPKAFAKGTAADALHQVIQDAGLDPRRVCLVNALQVDRHGRETKLDERLTEWFPQVPVVALGAKASKVLGELEVDHIMGDHPMFTRRFFTNAQTAYAGWLRGELKRWHDQHDEKE